MNGRGFITISMANGAALNGECPEFPAGSVPITATPSSPAVDPPGSSALRLAFVDPVGGHGDITMITVV
ncbi:hypothetical protein RI103_26580 [Paraburkholderia sp. FT54]|uniref:hypothetical protein n=1 Tax=Paraburkholderia sp. FT54 TaxID=3074437 RepID=UPI0028773901|nr:hypothetical protein [Paraburkholderia sp. FT54]WNC91864.1 hypothetical protein RI103_26580 [Paraburkholderia sp. FT54]